MTDLIDDVIYTILLQISLTDVSNFSCINRQFALVCRSDRGMQEIKRKYTETLVNEVLKIAGPKLFDMIRQNYISYLGNEQYVQFVKEIYPKTEQDKSIFDLFCNYSKSLCDIEMKVAPMYYQEPSQLLRRLVRLVNSQILREFLYSQQLILKQLRREIEGLVARFKYYPKIEEVD